MTPQTTHCLPDAAMARALARPGDGRVACSPPLQPYATATADLIRTMAAHGEQGMVIKFLVKDYADEAACGRAMTEFAKNLEAAGYRCCISYDTYALARHGDGISVSPMRNPEIIAMTIMW